MIETPHLENTSNSLKQLLGLSEVNISKNNNEYAFMLPNCTLVIREDTSLPLTKIAYVKINHQLENGSIDARVNEITLSHHLCEVIQ
jgi:hypothetical protein